MIKKCSSGKYRCFQGHGNKVLNLQICLYWAAVLIPILIALKHLMPVWSMWPIGPLVDIKINLHKPSRNEEPSTVFYHLYPRLKNHQQTDFLKTRFFFGGSYCIGHNKSTSSTLTGTESNVCWNRNISSRFRKRKSDSPGGNLKKSEQGARFTFLRLKSS